MIEEVSENLEAEDPYTDSDCHRMKFIGSSRISIDVIITKLILLKVNGKATTQDGDYECILDIFDDEQEPKVVFEEMINFETE